MSDMSSAEIWTACALPTFACQKMMPRQATTATAAAMSALFVEAGAPCALCGVAAGVETGAASGAVSVAAACVSTADASNVSSVASGTSMADAATFAPQPGQASSSVDICVPHSLQTIMGLPFY
jgi:hypothetical protein